MADGPKVCGGCSEDIVGKWMTGLDKHWHHECFKCVGCERAVEPTESFYEQDGKPLCFKCKAPPEVHTCKICNETISGQRLIYLDNTYHYGCKKCTKCAQGFLADQHDNIKIQANGDFIHAKC